MSSFNEHVIKGLSKKPKKLSSRYFYDKKGDELFQQIMNLDEYYLPQSELEIINKHSSAIANKIKLKSQDLEIVELGAGDGTKTQYFLESLTAIIKNVKYIPLDISAHILEINLQTINELVPELEINPVPGNYFKTYLPLPKEKSSRLVLFLGANIGNFTMEEAKDFMKTINLGLETEDFALIAFDLVKHPRKILSAYDDSKGVTKEFNINLLSRINKELGANFDLDAFDHYPTYNPETGLTSSYIISLKNQTVRLSSGEEFYFEAYEPIHTEVSKKFFKKDIQALCAASNFNISEWYFDSTKGYAFVLLEKTK